MSQQGKSPLRLAWRRFRKNIPATIGLVWLCICTLVAIFAYVLMPDDSSNANFQVIEIPKQPPGTNITVLLKPNFSDQAVPGFIDFLFNGRPDLATPIPALSLSSVKVSGDSIYYVDLRGGSATLSLPEFMLPLDKYHPAALNWKETEGKPYLVEGDRISYMDRSGSHRRTTLSDLSSRFRKDHILERNFLMGTDGYGRDVLSRLLLGTRVSMSVGLMAVMVSLVLGISVGAIAGFFRGWIDSVVMWFVSVVWSIPTLLLAISLSFVLGKGFFQLFLAIGVSMWVEVARIVRGQIFAVREMQYVDVTKAMGFRSFRIISRHILPNIFSPIIIVATANFAAAILIEAGLSFLGVGVQAPIPSWGSMIKEGYTQVMFESGAWLAIFPGLAIVLVVISLNLVGFGLRDAFDPKYDH